MRILLDAGDAHYDGGDLIRGKSGDIKLSLEEDEDMWHAYNLIAAGDVVTADTFRSVLKGSSGRRERMCMNLEIQAESVEYDKETSTLCVHGRNTTSNGYVKEGQSHVMKLELKRPFVLRKAAWDRFALDTLRRACAGGGGAAADARLAVVLMHEGHANLLLVGRSVTVTKAHVETSIPRKHRASAAAYQSALRDFFERALDVFLRHINLDVVRCVVLAGPGFTKDQFRDYLFLEAARRDLRAVLKNRASVVVAHASSGYKHSLKDVLDSPGVRTLIEDTMAAREVQELARFYYMAAAEPARAVYGPEHVELAHRSAAIESLLIVEDLFRNADVDTRKKYVALVESVEEAGGEVYVFSSMHVSGQQLAQMTGIAAILRFPMPGLDDETDMW